MAQLKCIVVTPETTALEAEVDFVVVPLYDGELGIGPSRGAMIGRLGYGELRLRTGERTQRFYVDGGFVQVADDVVSVLTNMARPAEKIEASTAQRHLDEAQKLPSNSPELMEIRDRKVAQARAQVRVAARSR